MLKGVRIFFVIKAITKNYNNLKKIKEDDDMFSLKEDIEVLLTSIEQFIYNKLFQTDFSIERLNELVLLFNKTYNLLKKVNKLNIRNSVIFNYKMELEEIYFHFKKLIKLTV